MLSRRTVSQQSNSWASCYITILMIAWMNEWDNNKLCCCYVLVCPAQYWGQNCETLCRCDAHECNEVSGCTSCTLYPGWTGPNCDEDINECVNATHYCGSNSDCTNTNGSFMCVCHNWYQRVSDRCVCKSWYIRSLCTLQYVTKT